MMPRNDCALSAPKFLTIAQFCQRYQVSRASAYRLAHKDDGITIMKFGRSSRIAFEEAETWAASLPKMGGQS